MNTTRKPLPPQIEQQEREGPVPDADGVAPVVFKADMEKSLFVRLLVHGYLVTFMLMARVRTDTPGYAPRMAHQ